MDYDTPAEQFEYEYVVKKSRFIARVVPVTSREEALAAVQASRRDYPDARHHCWAYLLGKPSDATNAGMNDDGEPAGTAGKPILNVIQHGLLGDVLVIVIRYFGGIKLGAGGLVRAYSTATQQVLERVPALRRQILSRICAKVEFSKEQLLRHWLAQNEGVVEQVEYGEHVVLTLSLPEDRLIALSEFCAANRVTLDESSLGG